jgi:hypothetical protein
MYGSIKSRKCVTMAVSCGSVCEGWKGGMGYLPKDEQGPSLYKAESAWEKKEAGCGQETEDRQQILNLR